MAEKYVDCRGLQCPGPLVDLARAAKSAAKGDVIVVDASDFGFKKDVRAWCAKTGHTLENVEETDGIIRARIVVV
ncbi:MAG: sulfurtransferase TusA family protein [Firmicutes bacterium]|nr:sulfurtransferase TusA family protein [Bacillota bacterium]